jgi:branched-chain amino acid transport system ATP-binding protein
VNRSGSSCIALNDVVAGYGTSRVLNGLTLELGQRETLALLGPNGSGKSTVARTIMGLTKCFSGTIEWNGREITRSATWRRSRLGIGYVPQVDNVFRELTINDNLLVGAGGVRSRKERQRRVDDVYELFSVLQARRNVSGDKLSGGERRLLSFASALVQEPKVLVLDEPTSDLAPAAIDVVIEKIVEIRETFKIPVLLIEQNAVRALEISDDVCLLIRGNVIERRAARNTTEAEIAKVFLEVIDD